MLVILTIDDPMINTLLQPAWKIKLLCIGQFLKTKPFRKHLQIVHLGIEKKTRHALLTEFSHPFSCKISECSIADNKFLLKTGSRGPVYFACYLDALTNLEICQIFNLSK